jgi:hypothetical protein
MPCYGWEAGSDGEMGRWGEREKGRKGEKENVDHGTPEI